MTLEDSDDEEFRTGPFSMLHDAVKNNKQIGISLHNNQNLVGHVRAFDRHFNMELENVKEMKDSRGIQVPTKVRTVNHQLSIQYLKCFLTFKG